MDQELPNAAAYVQRRRFVCSHLMAALFCMSAILKVWHQIKNPTPSIDANVFEEQCTKFHSGLKRWSLRLFLKRLPPKKEQDEQR